MGDIWKCLCTEDYQAAIGLRRRYDGILETINYEMQEGGTLNNF